MAEMEAETNRHQVNDTDKYEVSEESSVYYPEAGKVSWVDQKSPDRGKSKYSVGKNRKLMTLKSLLDDKNL